MVSRGAARRVLLCEILASAHSDEDWRVSSSAAMELLREEEVESQPQLVHAPYLARPDTFLAEADWSVPVFTARKRADAR